MGTTLATADNYPVLLAYLTGVWTWFPFRVDGQTLFDWKYHISWSVSTELFFYVAYAVVLHRLSRVSSVRQCVALLIGLCLGAYAVFYVAYLTRDAWETGVLRNFPGFVPRTENFTLSFYRWLLYFSPYSRIFEFIGGVLTCQLFRLVSARPALLERINRDVLAWLAIAVMAILFGLFRYYGEANPWLATDNHSFPGFIVSLHMNFLLAPPCYLLIFALAPGGTRVGRVLAARPARFLGDISYSTYLFHPLAERTLTVTGIVLTSTVPRLLAIMIVVYFVSWLLYSLVEGPAKRALRQLLESRRLGLAAPGART